MDLSLKEATTLAVSTLAGGLTLYGLFNIGIGQFIIEMIGGWI